MSLERQHDQDHVSSSTSDCADLHGKAAGKRNRTDALQPGGDPDAASVRTLQSSAAPDAPDPFDFSFAKPVGATDQAAEAEVKKHIDAGERNVNSITDRLFYRLHPELAGKKLKPGSEGAQTWIFLRDSFVAPAVREAPEAHATLAPAQVAEAPAAPAQPAPAPAPAAPAPAPTRQHEADQAGGNVYRTQNDNLYMAGGTCNMTSLTMALLDMTNGDEMVVKTKAGEALRNLEKPLGGIMIDKKKVDLVHALETPELLEKIQVEDLLTTLAGLMGLKVTNPKTILKVAQATGLAKSGDAGVTGYMKDPKTRARAAEAVRNGQKIILGVMGGPGHFVYLTEVLDDGFIAHDPAGCRCQYDAPFFLPRVAASRTTPP